MRLAQCVVVVSDLHLAPEYGCGLFRSDDALAAFLEWILDSVPCELVLGGDTFDFMVPPDGRDSVQPFDPAGAAARMEAVLECHPRVVEALSTLARSARHHLVVVGGNHDPELVLPDVQHVVERRLSSGEGHARIRWLVHGEAATFQVGAARLVVEHGDQYDPWNRIDHGALREALSLVTRGLDPRSLYSPPAGTLLVHRFVNPVRREGLPWVDVLKPERKAVVPLLREFLPTSQRGAFAAAVLLAVQAQIRSALDAVMATVRPELVMRGSGAGSASQDEAFQEWLQWAQQPSTRGLKAEAHQGQLVARLRRVAHADGFFDLSAVDEVAPRVEFLTNAGWDLVIHGHTHAAKAYRCGKGLYLNAGTWAQLMRLPSSDATDAEWAAFLAALQPGGMDRTFARPTFVGVRRECENSEAAAEVCEWKAAGPETLAAWRFGEHRWSQEV